MTTIKHDQPPACRNGNESSPTRHKKKGRTGIDGRSQRKEEPMWLGGKGINTTSTKIVYTSTAGKVDGRKHTTRP